MLEAMHCSLHSLFNIEPRVKESNYFVMRKYKGNSNDNVVIIIPVVFSQI